VEQLEKTETFQEKLATERMILDVESRILQTQLKLSESMKKVHILSTKWLNEWMKKNNREERYVSYDDMLRVPSKSHQKIRKLLKDE